MDWIPAPLATVAAWGLIATFGWAAVAKLVRSDAWPAAVAGFGFEGPAARVVAVAVPVLEGAIVVFLATGVLRLAGALTLTLVAAFSAAIVRVRTAGSSDKVPCGCFGGSGETDYRLLLGRNAALAVLAALVLLGPRSTSLVLPAGTELVPTALVVVAGILLTWVAVQTVSSLRRR